MDKPNYYAIIPAEVRYDPDLKPNEKLLYGEITALASKEGFCWATNEYFSKLYGVGISTVSAWINHLKKKRYITIEVERKGKVISQRKIGIPKKQKGYSEKVEDGYSEKAEKGIPKKPKENNTRENITSMNNTSNDILSYFNEKMGKNLRMTDSVKKLIYGRLNEGFTLDDFKKVIDTKYAQWHKDAKMKQYLRPSTLFSPTHFQEYLSEDERKELGKVWK